MSMLISEADDLLQAAGFRPSPRHGRREYLTQGRGQSRVIVGQSRVGARGHYAVLTVGLVAVPDSERPAPPYGTLYEFHSLGALKAHLTPTINALQSIHLAHIACAKCHGWLNAVRADSKGGERFECVSRPASKKHEAHSPNLTYSELPVIVRYDDQSVPPLFPELDPPAKRALMQKVFAALNDALPQATAITPFDHAAWHPEKADCHGNARRWVAAHPGYDLVTGWLHEPFADSSNRFHAHTLVRNSNRELVDVTLGRRTEPMRFLEHPTDPREFDQLVHTSPHRVPTLSTEIVRKEAE